MKILYLTILDLDSQCGSTIHVLESVKKLRLLGNQVKLIGSSTNPYNKQELGDFTNLFFSLNLITGRIIECMFFKVLFLLNLLYLILRNIYTYDVVYIRDYYSGMMLSILGKKYICEVNGIPGEDLIKQNLRYLDIILNYIYRKCIKFTLLNAERVIVVSELLKMEINHKYNVNLNKTDIIYNGANIDIFFPVQDKKEITTIKKRFNIPENHSIATFAGYIAPWRNLTTFVELSRGILKKIPNTTFLIVGDGPELNKVKTKAADLDLNSHYIFPGYIGQNELNLLFNLSNLCFSFSTLETKRIITSPIKIYEYLACAKPVLTIKGHSLKHLAEYITMVDNYDDFCNSFIEMIQRKSQNTKGYEYLINNQTWEHVLRRVEKVILKCV